ncbi:hypothetical protein N9U64_01170 [Pseudomonadota bacterium]|nr:hypothetical protein [Pseudomonadota bacterium]
MIGALFKNFYQKITLHWLLIPIAFFTYLLWNTGLHGDDYAEIHRLKDFTLYDFYFASTEDYGVFLFGLPIYFSLYWAFPFFGMDWLLAYDLIKITVHIISTYFIFIFFRDYLPRDRAILAAFLFILFPLHDATNYWYMALSYILVPSILLLAHHFIRKKQYFVGIWLSALGCFAFYASLPLVFGLGCIFLLQRKYKEFLIYITPGIAYTIYYLFMKMTVDGLEVKIDNNLSLSGYLQDLFLQFLTMMEASIGPSAFIKVFYSIGSLSLLSLSVLIFALIFLSYHLRIQQFSQAQNINFTLLFGLGLVVLLSMMVYAMTGAYWHTPFNLSNRSLIYASLFLSYLIASCIRTNRSFLLLSAAIFLSANLGISDHWKSWNIEQKIVIERINSNPTIQSSPNATFFISENLYSHMGPYSYIEFFSMPWNIRAIFNEDVDTNFIAVTPYLKLEKNLVIDTKSKIHHPVNKEIYHYNSSSGVLSKISIEDAAQLVAEEKPIHRHWIQYFKGTIIENIVVRLAPNLAYLFT